MKYLLPSALVFPLVILACSTSPLLLPAEPGSATATTKIEFPSDSGANIPYPSANWGGKVGQVLPNFTLTGIRSAATLDQQATLAMSEYFDPEGSRYDLLHIVAIVMWCPHCNTETKSLVQLASWQASRRIATVEIVMQGYGRAAPTWTELQGWVRNYQLPFPLLLDPQGETLEKYFNLDYIPVNILVNPRTMTILAVEVGAISDLEAYEKKFLP